MNDKFHSTGILRAVGVTVLLAIGYAQLAVAQQQIVVTGKVTSTAGAPVQGVTVRIRGTETSTLTDADGKYSLTAPSDGVLVFGRIGFRELGQSVAGKTNIDVQLENAIAVLPEVVVTGYTEQKRRDIIGAVSIVNTTNIEKQTTTSVLQRLDGQVPGVTVTNSGSPGSRSTVRVRGISSFQNNDPLYIVDGVPLQDSYINWLNPEDIGEIQVLKDASAASIYGSRASNGVVIIETKKGRPGPRRITLDVKTGVSNPVRGMDDFMITDALQYYQVVKQSYLNSGQAIPTIGYPANIYGTDPNNPQVPTYIWPNDGKVVTNPATVDPSTYSYPDNLIMRGSPGTDWWKAVFGSAMSREANLSVTGGGTDNSYAVSFNALDQEGTAAFTRLNRGTLRVNTTFQLDKVSVGENVAISREQHYGGLPDDPGGYAEDGILGKDILMQPVIPIFDIGGNFAGAKASGLGNQTNPLKWATDRQFDRNTNDRIFGSAFAGFDVTHHVSFKTRLGFNLRQENFRGYTPTTPQDAEPQTTNGINENEHSFTSWTWSNTLHYVGAFGKHGITVLLGHSAEQSTDRLLTGSIGALLNTDVNSRYIQNALASAATKDVSSAGGLSRLLSLFGKADYSYNERYYLSLTLRRDGSSNFGPGHQWGTFPAVGLGWRVSQESFFPFASLFSNALIRVGYGVTGNEQIPSGRIVSQFGGATGDTYYDITGSGNSIHPGFRLTAIGNPNLKWEEDRATNVGLDLSFAQNKGSFTADWYHRDTKNLLFPPALPGTAGAAAPPIVNIGKVSNRGVDFSIGYNGTLGEKTLWSVNFNGSHYSNKIENIDGQSTYFFGPISTRYGTQTINMLGEPIGAFFGLQADGYFQTQAEIDQLNTQAQAKTGDPTAVYQPSAAPGRIRFRDVNGDGVVTLADRTIIGSPHPKFTGGLDFTLRHGAWDFSATVFGSFGAKIFDVEKEFYVFRLFNTDVRKDVLTDSWTPSNPNAKYPILEGSLDPFSHSVSSFYLESGSYVRMRALQIGFTPPAGFVRWIPAQRIYLQAENLFTITGYPGLDPSLPSANIYGASGDLRDQYMGVDRGNYPSNRTFTIGITTTF